MFTYSQAEIKKKLADYHGWSLGDDGQLHGEFVFKDFCQVMLFAAAVGHLAEAANHHPDLFIHSYRHLRISVFSHDAKGITDRDFRLIEQINALPMRS